jgi:hypothetical protein
MFEKCAEPIWAIADVCVFARSLRNCGGGRRRANRISRIPSRLLRTNLKVPSRFQGARKDIFCQCNLRPAFRRHMLDECRALYFGPNRCGDMSKSSNFYAILDSPEMLKPRSVTLGVCAP